MKAIGGTVGYSEMTCFEQTEAMAVPQLLSSKNIWINIDTE
jgi:hypothetical protein